MPRHHATPDDPRARIMDILHGPLVAQLVAVAAELGLADLVADGPRTVDELAGEVGADPDALGRVLRALAGVGVFGQVAPGTYAATELSDTLRREVPGSLRHWARLWGVPERGAAIGALLHSVRTGEPAFEHLYGSTWWRFLADHPERAAVFRDAMGDLSRELHLAAVRTVDLSGVRRLVDVGGGEGHLVAALLRRHPGLTATVFDQPEVAPHAAEVLAAAGVADRARVAAGNFFTEVPGGADAYLLSMILHDWDDERAVTILRAVRRAMSDDARVLIVDAVVPEDDAPHDGKLRDILMLTLHPGRERTEREFVALLGRAGLRHKETYAVSASTGLLVAVAA